MLDRLRRLPRQLLGECPFAGDRPVDRLPLLAAATATARHVRTPLRILDWVFPTDAGPDLRYLDVPGFPPVLFVRDPALIRAVTTGTANGGPFDRDTLPTQGIARVVGGSNLLFAQGEVWRKHRSAAAPVFGAGRFRTPAAYQELEQAVRKAVEPQVDALADRIGRGATARVAVEPHIQAAMLDVLVNVVFGAAVPHAELRDRYLPATANVIRYILVDTVANQLGLPVFRLPAVGPRHAALKQDRETFEELATRVTAARDAGAGFWPRLAADGPDEAVRSNVRVFLAGALEATSSYLGWALSDLARNPDAQTAAREEADRTPLTPAGRESATVLRQSLAESLRLHNALYFLPRVAVRDAELTTPAGRLRIPAGTHLVLATYHANRCERFWGVAATGHPARSFAPQRWAAISGAWDALHFGFGHGPRVCIGKHFSEAEAFVCLALFLRRFEFRAARSQPGCGSGVSTRPADGVTLDLTVRPQCRVAAVEPGA